MSNVGVLGGTPPESIVTGLLYFAACLAVAIGGFFSAIAQGRVCVSGVNIIAKKPSESGELQPSRKYASFYQRTHRILHGEF
jgi:V/A-type H+-transporting ATPase subunit K